MAMTQVKLGLSIIISLILASFEALSILVHGIFVTQKQIQSDRNKKNIESRNILPFERDLILLEVGMSTQLQENIEDNPQSLKISDKLYSNLNSNNQISSSSLSSQDESDPNIAESSVTENDQSFSNDSTTDQSLILDDTIINTNTNTNIDNTNNATDTTRNEFVINLFETGDRDACMYSWFCSCCAIADSKTALDGSSYWLNFFCLQCQLAPLRWLTRSAYDIGNLDSGIQDILYSMFCPCCTVNQLYQTIQQRKNPSQDGGVDHNSDDFLSDTDRSCDQCCEACILQPCAQGKIMSHVVGMPYYLGCLCMNILTVRNVMRYQYRIKPTFGGDVYDEILMPIGYCFGGLLICNPIIGFALHVALSVQVVREMGRRPACPSRRYMLGFQPTATAVVPVTPMTGMNRHASASTIAASGRSINNSRVSVQTGNRDRNQDTLVTVAAVSIDGNDYEQVYDIPVHTVEIPQRPVRVVKASQVKRYSDPYRSPFA